jgi:hypothetical protein
MSDIKQGAVKISSLWWRGHEGNKLIWDQIVRLTRDPDLIAVSVFAVIGLLVSLSLAAFYPTLAAESWVNMPW